MQSAADQANQEMVDRLIAEAALWSRPLIAAFRATPRHVFLDRVFQYQRKHNRWREVLTRDPGPEELAIIYSDRALITHLQCRSRADPGTPISSSSQPSLMAQMLEDLKLAPGLRTLEVGAGTGYNAALLAHVVGPGLVTSVDVDRSVLSEAWDHLRAFPERGIDLKHADGRSAHVGQGPVQPHHSDGGNARPGTGLAGATGRKRPLAGPAGFRAGIGLCRLWYGRARGVPGPAHAGCVLHGSAGRGRHGRTG